MLKEVSQILNSSDFFEVINGNCIDKEKETDQSNKNNDNDNGKQEFREVKTKKDRQQDKRQKQSNNLDGVKFKTLINEWKVDKVKHIEEGRYKKLRG
eukprot:CAMPEP_0116907768 /NCGR_PEP_ID=MMETSP0467-20121206/13301_1 /TAXON_ID=283647 /ORGANISM="Mesodinium pulex, Strain SPMC105" /LENGTH=96 /DNA_ID=CAMNT_0004582847 /DNA_START=2142 /DNA_END=2432 /DNA_ORIENTATION=+